MIIHRIRTTQIFASILIFFISCKKDTFTSAVAEQKNSTAASTQFAAAAAAGCFSYTDSNFTPGAFTSAIVPSASLQNLGCSLSNNNIVVSNNPEIVMADGWLFKSTALSGGAVPVNGNFNLYIYHDNRSGKNLYLDVFIVNASLTSSVSVSGKGNMFTSNQYSGFNGHGFGPSYKVADNWMSNIYSTANFSNVNIPKSSASSDSYYCAASVSFPSSRTIDGRFEFTASGPCYVYVVVSTSSKISNAFTATVGKRSTGTYNGASTWKPETANTFGRECGLYAYSGWSGVTDIYLPSAAGYMGLCLNTAAKYAIPGTSQYFQDQNAPMIARIDDASTKTYGNYGHYYDLALNLNNPQAYTKTVNVWMATKNAGNTNASFWFHAPVKIDSVKTEVFLTGPAPKQLLKTYTIPAGSSVTNTLQFYIPGLISTDEQLIIESVN